MFNNAFVGKTIAPSDLELTTALGDSRTIWDRLLDDLSAGKLIDGSEWKSHSAKWGWSLRVKYKKRTIVWLSPGFARFDVLFILGDAAVAAARQAKLPKPIVAALEAAPKYPEGTGLRLTARRARDLAALKKLAAIKAAN